MTSALQLPTKPGRSELARVGEFSVPQSAAPRPAMDLQPMHTIGEIDPTVTGGVRIKLSPYGEMILVGLALLVPLAFYALGLGLSGHGFLNLVGALAGFCLVYIAGRAVLVHRHRKRRNRAASNATDQLSLH